MGENNCKWSNWQRINLKKYASSSIAENQTIQLKTGGLGGVEDLNRRFFKKGVQMANKYKKNCATLLIIIEMQIKTAMGYHLTQVRMVTIKKSTNNKWWKGCREREPFCTVGGNGY